MRAYFREWLRRAFTSSLGQSDLWAGAIGAALAAIVPRVWPDQAAHMTDLAWQVPLGAFASVFVARLILTPYWMHREVDTERRTLRASLDQRGRQRAVSECISRRMAEGNALQVKLKRDFWGANVMHGDPILAEITEWDQRTIADLREVAPNYAEYFARDVNRKSPEMIARGRAVWGGEIVWYQVDQKLDRLSDILKSNNAGELV